MYKDWLYFETPDCHLICLNAKDGKVRWDVELADAKLGYFATMAPLVVQRPRHRRRLRRRHRHSRLPRIASIPKPAKCSGAGTPQPKPGEPGSETWPKDGDAIAHGGGMTWMTGTYDPELNLLYWGTGNPNPVLAGDGRAGRQPVHLLDRRAEPRHRQTGLVFPALAARHARLGRRADAGAVRRRFQRRARASCWRRPAATATSSCSTAPPASTCSPRRSSTPTGRPASISRGRPIAEARERAEARWRAGRAGLRRRHQLDGAQLRSRHRLVLRQRAPHLQHLLYDRRRQAGRLGRPRPQPLGGLRLSKPSTTRPARSAGSTRSATAKASPAS